MTRISKAAIGGAIALGTLAGCSESDSQNVAAVIGNAINSGSLSSSPRTGVVQQSTEITAPPNSEPYGHTGTATASELQGINWIDFNANGGKGQSTQAMHSALGMPAFTTREAEFYKTSAGRFIRVDYNAEGYAYRVVRDDRSISVGQTIGANEPYRSPEPPPQPQPTTGDFPPSSTGEIPPPPDPDPSWFNR